MNERKFQRIIYVAHDHLNSEFGALRNADSARDVVVLVESQRMLEGRSWHKERLFFLLASARHFARDLRDAGFEVAYIKAANTVEGLRLAREKYSNLAIVCAEPSSFKQYRLLLDFGVEFVKNDFFLTSRELFSSWASSQKTFVMENFYRAQRVRLGILFENGKPTSGRWNFDADNRLPPPKNYKWPKYLEHERDDVDFEVLAQLGHHESSTWATTKTGALKQLNYFVEHHLAGFGPYEDAVARDNWAMHHSLLSPYLNNGLLHPSDVVRAVLEAFETGKAGLPSVEALIRQIIGWREYINGMYWYLGEDYRNMNSLNANRKLLPLYNDSSKTKMACVSDVVEAVETRAWVHHIPRLMVLSNLALTTGVNPQEFLNWMREKFIDAADWVMVPNVIGMAVYADAGKLMTKPYASGGAYLNRMTQSCKGCVYDPKLRVGDNACPFTTLYWDFLDRHRESFVKNHRMSQQLQGLNRLGDLPQVRERAIEVLAGLDAGTI